AFHRLLHYLCSSQACPSLLHYSHLSFFALNRRHTISLLFPYTTLFRSFFDSSEISESVNFCVMEAIKLCRLDTPIIFIASMTQKDRKSGSAGMPRPTSYAGFCLEKKTP